MRKTNKRGFTIVELVIVIAVIAILAAVLIPTFTNLVKKANVTADTQLVRNLNTALKLDNTKHETMYDALKAVNENGGFDVAKINASVAKNEILWDSVNDCFVYLNDGNITYIPNSKEKDIPANEQYRYWRIFKELPDGNNPYSIYWNGGNLRDITVTGVGFDAGNANVASVTYEGASDARDVVIRTNGGTLIVNDTNPESEQVHYGTLSSAEVTTGTSCFYTHGTIGTMGLKAGKAIVDEGGYVGLIKAAEGTQVIEQNGGVFVIPSNATISDIPESVVTQLDGYSISGNAIIADETREAKSFYSIGSVKQLNAFRDGWNKGTIAITKVKLTADIDLSEATEEWTPFGTWEYPYYGTFDGNGHTIKGLKRTKTDDESVWSKGTSTQFNGVVFGFVAIAGGGDVEIKDITFTDVEIKLTSGANSGSVIGYAPKHSDFTSGDKGGAYWTEAAGGDKKVLPANFGTNDVTLKNVTVYGLIEAKQHIGGLIGKTYNTGKVSVIDSSFTGNITVSATSGGAAGIIGWPSGYSAITVKGCTVEGNIKGGTPEKGPLVGKLDSISKNTVLDRNTTSNAHVLDANDVEVPQNFTVNYEYNSDGSVKTVTVNGTSIPYNTRVYENCVVSINTGTYYTLKDCEVYNSAIKSYVKIYGNTTFDNSSFVYFNNHEGNTADELWQVEMTNTTFTNYTFRVKNGQNLTLNNNVKFTFKPNASGNGDYSVSGSNNNEKQANSYHVRVCNGGYLTLNSSYSYETVANTTAYYTNYNDSEDNGFLVYLEVGSIFNSETVTEAHFIWVKAK